jgi:hypothetical protein
MANLRGSRRKLCSNPVVLGRKTLTIFAAFAAAAVLVVVAPSELAADPWRAFVAQSEHGRAGLALRVGLLTVAVFGLAPRRDLRAVSTLAVVLALFAASLAFAGVVVPFAIVAFVALLAFTRSEDRARISVWISAVAGASLLLCLPWFSPPKHGSAPRLGDKVDVGSETARWLERDNLFRARQFAAAWASAETGGPGEAALLVCRIDWRLGHRARARGAALNIAANAPARDVAARAAEFAASWAKTSDAE